MVIEEITIKLSDVDRDVLNSATLKNIKPKVSLVALCGDIIIDAYKIKRKEDEDANNISD